MRARIYIPEVILGFLLAVTIFAMGFVFGSSSSGPAKKQPESQTSTIKDASKPTPFSGAWFTLDAVNFFAGLMFLIGTLQGGLFIWQLILIRKSLNPAEKTAAAALASAEATRDQVDFSFRPKIRIKHLWLTNDIWEGEQVVATMVFVNSGTATAMLREIGFATLIVNRGQTLPTDPNVVKNQTFVLEGQELSPGVTLEIKNLNDFRVLTDAENVKIRRGDSKLFWIGYVEYQDRRGALRKTSFCRVLEFALNATATDRGRFIRVDDPDYEYED